ncbi:hypothetical protein E4U54_004286, partial [Claviceps lovelessii]
MFRAVGGQFQQRTTHAMPFSSKENPDCRTSLADTSPTTDWEPRNPFCGVGNSSAFNVQTDADHSPAMASTVDSVCVSCWTGPMSHLEMPGLVIWSWEAGSGKREAKTWLDCPMLARTQFEDPHMHPPSRDSVLATDR